MEFSGPMWIPFSFLLHVFCIASLAAVGYYRRARNTFGGAVPIFKLCVKVLYMNMNMSTVIKLVEC